MLQRNYERLTSKRFDSTSGAFPIPLNQRSTLGPLRDPAEMTGLIQSILEAPATPGVWVNVDVLPSNQYAWVSTSTATGYFAYGFAPSQTIVKGTEPWGQMEDRFDLYGMIAFLSPEQTTNLKKTVLKFFTDTVVGRQIIASYDYLPCFSKAISTLPIEADPLPDFVIEAFDTLNTIATPPEPEALRLSKSWANSLYSEIKTQKGIWIDPHLTVQDGGDVVFEWWHEHKSLSVYISVDEIWFLQSAGPNSEQTEGDASTVEVRQSIWQWLTQ
jgi:hypothetical protein